MEHKFVEVDLVFTASPRTEESSIIEESSRRLFHNVYVGENPHKVNSEENGWTPHDKGRKEILHFEEGCPAVLLSHCKHAFLIKLISYLTLRLSFSRSHRLKTCMMLMESFAAKTSTLTR